MMAEKMVPLCKSARTSSTKKMWPQTEHSLTGVEEFQAQVLSAETLSEGPLHIPSLISRPSPLLRDVPLPIPRPMLVVFLPI